MRYTFYFTPPADDPLTDAAARWLGRDAFTGTVLAPDGQRPDGWESLVAEPARYGFHATLKAPFHLAGGRTEANLLSALDVFAAETPAFTIPRLKIGRLGSFFALVPDGDADALDSFAADVVRAFEPFRAPLSAADIARRKPETLPEPERTYLHDWGYPYVFDAFRFHMTLTGPVPAERQDEVVAHLDARFSSLIGGALPVRGLALFTEPERGAPFTIHSLLPLGGTSKRKMA
ncbi:DUF1045 domain-containing protein [Pararhizobium sp.]|uniref:DUF1045 domain-containing protein n=1 Tax=Pararhizobium sp. TaxID=1977563 RepID=UPI003D108EFC